MDAREFFKCNPETDEAFFAADGETFATEEEVKDYADGRNIAYYPVTRQEVEEIKPFNMPTLITPSTPPNDNSVELYGMTAEEAAKVAAENQPNA